MHSLAIVIPAYKPEYFRDALASIDAQTDRRFCVYVGDDAGPEALRTICEDFPGLDLTYRRFDQNLGGRSLAKQWNRCVEMSSEPWVWLFSDDDVMSPDCVSSFYDGLPTVGPEDLIRFDTDLIGPDGEVVTEHPRHPAEESGTDFVFSRLAGTRSSFVVEYVFPRHTFERAGGFVDYPVGWCSDDVSWFRFSSHGKIRTLPRGKVLWRSSGVNITGDGQKHQAEKLAAGGLFMDFVQEVVEPADGGRRTSEAWRRARARWLKSQFRYLMPMSRELRAKCLEVSEGIWRGGPLLRSTILSFWNIRATARNRRRPSSAL